MNKHVESYLDYYCSLKNSPEYGILIKGAWGAGKTWFIKKYIKKLEAQKSKCIYVSLYGITKTTEIEDIFFQQLHPILSSKGMAITSKILKGALKATVKIDLDGDDKADGSVGAQIPDINFPDYLKNTENCILFFDDLERCKMGIDNILGYINHFVEHQGLKAIIIANEEELIKKENNGDGENSGYVNIKEKLIGKTFQIFADLDNAISEFTSGVENIDAKNFLLENNELIKQIYNLSGYENLRNLKQALWDFERIYVSISKTAQKIEGLLCDILSLLLAYSFELRRGSILPGEIISFRSEYYKGRFSDKNNKEESKFKKIIRKYSEKIPLHDPIPNEHFWRIFFDMGYSDRDLMEDSIGKSKYFKDEKTPNWVRLWHLLELSDDEFDRIFHAVNEDFNNRIFTDIGVVKHIVGLYLWTSEIGLYEATKDEILKSSKEYVEYLKDQGELSFEDDQGISFMKRESYAGLCFFGNETKEFREFCDYVEKCQVEAKVQSMPDAGQELLHIMANDVSKFSRMICFCNSEDQIYYDTPIFKYIPPEEFVAAFLKIEPDNRRKIIFALNERYKFEDIYNKLLEELDWLKSIKIYFEAEAKERKCKVSGYVLSSAIDSYINPIIQKLEKEKKPGQQSGAGEPSAELQAP